MISELYYKALAPLIEFRGGKPYWIGRGCLAGCIGSHGYRQVGFSLDGIAKTILAHRVSFYISNGYLPRRVDHVDGDKDNNDISNLRECSQSQNMMNRRKGLGVSSSQYKGVHWNKANGNWNSRIGIGGRSAHLGCFKSEHDAADAYNRAATTKFGEFAKLNIIEEIT